MLLYSQSLETKVSKQKFIQYREQQRQEYARREILELAIGSKILQKENNMQSTLDHKQNAEKLLFFLKKR